MIPTRMIRSLWRSRSSPGNVSATEVAIIRGFPAFTLYRNGFSVGGNAPVDLANIERVEVLKGPASTLHVFGEPGGLANFVTRRPLEEPAFSAEQQVGSYGFYRTILDPTGPVIADRRLLYRATAAYTDAQTFREHAEFDRVFLAPDRPQRLRQRRPARGCLPAGPGLAVRRPPPPARRRAPRLGAAVQLVQQRQRDPERMTH